MSDLIVHWGGCRNVSGARHLVVPMTVKKQQKEKEVDYLGRGAGEIERDKKGTFSWECRFYGGKSRVSEARQLDRVSIQ